MKVVRSVCNFVLVVPGVMGFRPLPSKKKVTRSVGRPQRNAVSNVTPTSTSTQRKRISQLQKVVKYEYGEEVQNFNIGLDADPEKVDSETLFTSLTKNVRPRMWTYSSTSPSISTPVDHNQGLDILYYYLPCAGERAWLEPEKQRTVQQLEHKEKQWVSEHPNVLFILQWLHNSVGRVDEDKAQKMELWREEDVKNLRSQEKLPLQNACIPVALAMSFYVMVLSAYRNVYLPEGERSQRAMTKFDLLMGEVARLMRKSLRSRKIYAAITHILSDTESFESFLLPANPKVSIIFWLLAQLNMMEAMLRKLKLPGTSDTFKQRQEEVFKAAYEHEENLKKLKITLNRIFWADRYEAEKLFKENLQFEFQTSLPGLEGRSLFPGFGDRLKDLGGVLSQSVKEHPDLGEDGM